jgi:streptogramin lyase
MSRTAPVDAESASPTHDEHAEGGDPTPGSSLDSPGADLFKRWLWLPGPVALTYLAATAVRRPSSVTDSYLVVAAVACLPAQVLAWSWASNRWMRWKDWRFAGAVALAAVTIGALVVAVTEQARPATDRTYRIGLSPNDIVTTADAFWVSDTDDEVVYRVPNGDEPVVPIAVPHAFELATDGSSVWVSQAGGEDQDGQSSAVSHLSKDGAVEATFALPSHPADIAADQRWVWFAFVDTGAVGRLDPRSGDLAVWHVGEAPASLAIDGDTIWVTDVEAKHVSGLDMATGRVRDVFDTGAAPVGIDADRNSVWVTNAESDTVTYYDAQTKLRSQFRVPALPTDIAVRDDTLWIVSQEAQQLMAVDARTGESRHEIALDGQPNRLEVAGSDVFVANPGTGVVHRLSTESPPSRDAADAGSG